MCVTPGWEEEGEWQQLSWSVDDMLHAAHTQRKAQADSELNQAETGVST